ncbi:MAG: hypothetical protein AB7P02_12905 [Alphaproteobacteria bacterium]
MSRDDAILGTLAATLVLAVAAAPGVSPFIVIAGLIGAGLLSSLPPTSD